MPSRSVARQWVSRDRCSDGNAEYERIREVARVGRGGCSWRRGIQAASRRAAGGAARLPDIDPAATLVSELAATRRSTRNWRVDAEAIRLASELAGPVCWRRGFSRAEGRRRAAAGSLGRGRRLHALNRPAVRWPEERLWFWKGMWIPESVATRREELGLADVFAERNLERRRVMVDVLGFESLVAGGERRRAGAAGRLRPPLAARAAAGRRGVRRRRGRQLHAGAGRLVPPLLPPRPTDHQDRASRRGVVVRAERPRLRAGGAKLMADPDEGDLSSTRSIRSSGWPTRSPAGAASATTGSPGPWASRQTCAGCWRRPGGRGSAAHVPVDTGQDADLAVLGGRDGQQRHPTSVHGAVAVRSRAPRRRLRRLAGRRR